MVSCQGVSQMKFAIQFEVKADKQEERVLVLAEHAIHIQTTASSSKSTIKTDYIKYSEIRSIQSKQPTKMTLLTVDDRNYSCTGNVDEVTQMITHILAAMQQLFPSTQVEHDIVTLDISPEPRMVAIEIELEMQRRSSEVGPCGGFRQTYTYFCYYHNTTVRDEVIWDIETVYVSRGSRRLILKEFDHLEAKDLLPIISTVGYSHYFISLDTSGVKLTNDCLTQLVHTVKRNKLLEELYMEDCGLKSDFWSRLNLAVSSEHHLHTLQLSNNPGLEDRGGSPSVVEQFTGVINKLHPRLTVLRLASCGLTGASASAMAGEMLTALDGMSVLSTLDLSGNSLKGEKMQAFQLFLAQPNSIRHLNLSRCDIAIEPLGVGLTRGCTQFLETIDLSGNHSVGGGNTVSSATVSTQSGPTDHLARFFSSALAIRRVILNKCRLIPDTLQSVLRGLNENQLYSAITGGSAGVDLQLAGCELRSPGATVLATFLPGMAALVSLDVSDNDFRNGVNQIIEALHENTRIRHLAIGANFSNTKSKVVSEIMEKLAELIQLPSSGIESLSLANSKLKGDLTVLLNNLAGPTQIRSLDISGNCLGDVGARILSRVLSVNTTMQELSWDNNNMTIQGVEEVVTALNGHPAIRRLNFPAADFASMLQKSPDKVAAVVSKIQRYRIVSVFEAKRGKQRMNTKLTKLDQDYQLTVAHQCIDRLAASVTTRLRNIDPTNPMRETASAVLQDASQAHRLPAKLHSLVTAGWTEGDSERPSASPAGGHELQEIVVKMKEDLQASLLSHLQKSTKAMLYEAGSECPHTWSSGNSGALTGEIRDAMSLEVEQVSRAAAEAVMHKGHVGEVLTDQVYDAYINFAYLTTEHLLNAVLTSLADVGHQLDLVSSGGDTVPSETTQTQNDSPPSPTADAVDQSIELSVGGERKSIEMRSASVDQLPKQQQFVDKRLSKVQLLGANVRRRPMSVALNKMNDGETGKEAPEVGIISMDLEDGSMPPEPLENNGADLTPAVAQHTEAAPVQPTTADHRTSNSEPVEKTPTPSPPNNRSLAANRPPPPNLPKKYPAPGAPQPPPKDKPKPAPLNPPAHTNNNEAGEPGSAIHPPQSAPPTSGGADDSKHPSLTRPRRVRKYTPTNVIPSTPDSPMSPALSTVTSGAGSLDEPDDKPTDLFGLPVSAVSPPGVTLGQVGRSESSAGEKGKKGFISSIKGFMKKKPPVKQSSTLEAPPVEDLTLGTEYSDEEEEKPPVSHVPVMGVPMLGVPRQAVPFLQPIPSRPHKAQEVENGASNLTVTDGNSLPDHSQPQLQSQPSQRRTPLLPPSNKQPPQILTDSKTNGQQAAPSPTPAPVAESATGDSPKSGKQAKLPPPRPPSISTTIATVHPVPRDDQHQPVSDMNNSSNSGSPSVIPEVNESPPSSSEEFRLSLTGTGAKPARPPPPKANTRTLQRSPLMATVGSDRR